MEEAKTYCNFIFGAKEGSIWYEDWKLWTGLLGYGLVWGKWLLKGLDWSFESKTLQCFSLDLIFLHLLQYTRFGILMIFGILLIQTLVLTYAAFVPLDLLKKGHFTAYSTYTRISGSLLQTCWIFLGQLLFGWFYLYSLYSSYDEVANAEYLFWFAGFISVQMTMFFARGADSHLGHGWNVSQAIYVFYHVEDLSFKKGMDDTSESFVISRAHWFLRSLFGFTINLLLREFIGYSVPILLMHFHNPIDCVIYSVAVNFIVTMDDISDTVYKVLRRRKSCQYDRLETGNVESVEHEVP